MRGTLATREAREAGGKGAGPEVGAVGGGGRCSHTGLRGRGPGSCGSSPDLSTARGRDHLRCGGRAPAALLQGPHRLRHSSNELALQSSDFRSQRASSGSSVGPVSSTGAAPALRTRRCTERRIGRVSAGADEDGAGLGVLVRATRRTTSRVYGGPSRRPALPSTGPLQPPLGNGEGSPTAAPSSPVLPAAKPRRRNSLRSFRGRAWGCSGVRDSPARAFLWENPSEKQLFPQNAKGGLCLRHRRRTVRLRRGLGLPTAVRPHRA